MNLDRQYKNPPFVEALCEFTFQSKRWDWTIPGLMYHRISKDFPKKRQQEWFGMQLSKGSGESQKLQHGIDKMQFLEEKERKIIQLSPNLLAINMLAPYLGWTTFKKDILRNIRIYYEIANPEKIKKISLRYINHINFDSEIDDKDYFSITPKLPSPIPDVLSGIFLRYHIPYNTYPEMNLQLILGTRPSPKNKVSVAFDLNMVSNQNYFELDKLEHWLDEAHIRLKTAFIVSLTEKAHEEIFQEVHK